MNNSTPWLADRTVFDPVLGYRRLSPLPDQARVDRFYQTTYYQEAHQRQVDKEDREWWYWKQVYLYRLDRLWDLSRSGTGKLLDIGAGFGWFLRAAREDKRQDEQWIGQLAVEMNWWAQQYLKKLKFPTVERMEELTEQLDAIHCCMVLEHLVDPIEALRGMWLQLKPGGSICIVVPNEENQLQQEMIGRFGYSPVHFEHINYFTQETITALMRECGFVIVDVESTFPMEWFALRTPLNYVRRPWAGHVAHWLRMGFEWAMLKTGRWKDLAHRWTRQNIGREVIVWARRPVDYSDWDHNGKGENDD